MAKPVTTPQWDATAVNIVTPPSGHLNNGWANGSKGVSSYMNWFMYWVYQWIVWLGARFNDNGDFIRGDKKRQIPFTSVKLVSGSTTSYTIDSFSTGGTCIFGIYLDLNEGERIKSISFGLGDSSGTSSFKLFKKANGVARVQVGTTLNASATGDQVATLTLATPEDYSSTYTYYVEMSFTGYAWYGAYITTDVV